MAKRVITYPIVWDINEKEHFKEIIIEIRKRSPYLAEQIKEGVRKNIAIIKKNPFIFEADRLKIDNDKTYRKFNVIHIRFVYKIENERLIFVRVRYSSCEPLDY